jgi:hypothetical protein
MQQRFVSACYNGDVHQVWLSLADASVNPSHDESAALRAAVGNNREHVVRMLLKDARVDPCACENACLHWAVRYNQTKILQMLLAESRVGGHELMENCICWAWGECLCIFLLNDRFGVGIYRHLYIKYHPDLVLQYDAMISQCLTMAWVARQLPPWSDTVLPLSERLKAALSN